MSFPKVKIVSGPHGRDTTIEIDGVKVTGASEFTLSGTVSTPTSLTIVYPVVEAEVDATIEVTAFNAEHKTYVVGKDSEDV